MSRRRYLVKFAKIETEDGPRMIRYKEAIVRPMSSLPQDSDKFIKAAKDAILHARAVCRRDKHLDCRSERAGMFITSLRRTLRDAGFTGSFVNEVCDTRAWIDAGVLNTERNWSSALKYKTLFEVAMSQAGKKGDVNDKLIELDAIIAIEQELAMQAKSINNEADKVLEGVKQLIVSNG